MIHGPDNLPEVIERAKVIVQTALVAQAESDGTPPTLRAMYVLKTQGALAVLAGGESLNRGIEREAEARNVDPVDLAKLILKMAADSVDLEVYRMQINCQIEAATDEAEVASILQNIGLEYTS